MPRLREHWIECDICKKKEPDPDPGSELPPVGWVIVDTKRRSGSSGPDEENACLCSYRCMAQFVIVRQSKYEDMGGYGL